MCLLMKDHDTYSVATHAKKKKKNINLNKFLNWDFSTSALMEFGAS